ncbi:MAG: DUF1624 domain-containing protein [Oscillibacter sp.]|nr:DUF1624 domain-containing protein [Oscillibacter sp.]
MKRFDILDAWRTLAIALMAAYHFLYDLYIFGLLSAAQLFSAPLNILERFICCSFILLAGASARFSRNNLRHGLVVLAAGLVVEIGAAVGGQVIRWGVLMLLGSSMVLYHFLGKLLRKLPGWAVALGGGALFFLTRWWTEQAMASVKWLYPLGFMYPGFRSADYFPLLPWFFLFLIGTVFGGWCLEHRDNRILAAPLPKALTWPGRHSLIIYVLHQPVLYGVSYLIWIWG